MDPWHDDRPLMKQIERKAPNPEWVQMYRQGIPAPKIAAVVGVAETTVRYHMTMANKQDPGLRAAHKAALPAAPRVTDAGRRNASDILALFTAEGRLPVRGRSKNESALAAWLTRCRTQAAAGTLSPAYAAVLDQIPGWRDHQTEDQEERALGGSTPRASTTGPQAHRRQGEPARRLEAVGAVRV
jgi:hypothetical protein